MHDPGSGHFDVPLTFSVHLVPEGGTLHLVAELTNSVNEACVLVHRRIDDVRDCGCGGEVDIDGPVRAEEHESHPQGNDHRSQMHGPAGTRRITKHCEWISDAAD